LLEFFLQKTETVFDYHDIKHTTQLNNNLFMTLLYLNDDEKVKLKQKNLYEPLKIQVKIDKGAENANNTSSN
jgi:chromatin segregation and condensation protein Rec8/ScpA/Scc1 (kleisin family)